MCTLGDSCQGGHWSGVRDTISLKECPFWAYGLGRAPLDSPHIIAASSHGVRIKRKGEEFTGTIIKDTWTIARGGGNGKEVVGRGGGERCEGKAENYLNNNKKIAFVFVAIRY